MNGGPRSSGPRHVALGAVLVAALGLLSGCAGGENGTQVDVGGRTSAAPGAAGTIPVEDVEDRDTPGSTDTPASDPSTTEREAPRGDDELFQAYVDALVASYDGEVTDYPWTREDVECIAPGWIDALGVDALQAAGVEPEDLTDDSQSPPIEVSQESAEHMADVLVGCGISLFDTMLGPMAARGPAVDSCLRASLTGDQVREMFVEAMTSGTEDPDRYDELLLPCMLQDPGHGPGTTVTTI